MYILNVNPYHVGLHVGLHVGYTPGDFHLSSTTYCRSVGRGRGVHGSPVFDISVDPFSTRLYPSIYSPLLPSFQTFLRPSDIVTVCNKEKQVYV